jgi:hypothetical protein
MGMKENNPDSWSYLIATEFFNIYAIDKTLLILAPLWDPLLVWIWLVWVYNYEKFSENENYFF